ncbi:Mitochondrial carrier domain superfamily [Fusarium oxysporum f. sp. vasinfectum]|nr:Mitochondrial carrier domain superfamily [Fusarium oxysporum f. sp. vasinfectum]
MGSDIKDTVWPDHPVPNSVKNLIHRFFELLDSQDTNVGNILADEIFAPDARAQFGAHVFTGTEVKVRMQMVPHEAKQSLLRTSLAIVQDEGVRGLYSGLSAGLTRALTYGAVRIGVYEELKQQAVTNGFGTASHLLIPIAFASGFAGAILGTPSDIANIRMQNDKSQPPPTSPQLPACLSRLDADEDTGRLEILLPGHVGKLLPMWRHDCQSAGVLRLLQGDTQRPDQQAR